MWCNEGGCDCSGEANFQRKMLNFFNQCDIMFKNSLNSKIKIVIIGVKSFLNIV